MTRKIYIVGIFFSTLWCGCAAHNHSSPRSRLLINGVSSGITPKAAEAFLLPKAKWRVTEKNSVAMAVQTADFQHLNMRGKLYLFFFKDKLRSTRFYPKDITAYRNLLWQNCKYSLVKSDSLNAANGTHIFVGGWADKFVQWDDPDLTNEYNDYVRCCT